MTSSPSHHDVGLPLSPDMSRSSTLPSPYRNKFEVPNIQIDSPVGLYNCPQQRTSQAFSSMDDLDALTYPAHVISPPKTSSPHRLTPTRSSFVNQHLIPHRDVLSQAQAVISRAEAATAAAISTQRSLERTSSSASSSVRCQPLLPNRELPALPTAKSSKSMDDLDALPSNNHHLPNTEEYPTHHHPSRFHRGYVHQPYPTTAALGSHSSTLLPGQTYPEPTKYSGMNTLQEVFYHREMRLAAASRISNPPPLPPPPKNKTTSGAESPPPPLYPKQYHQVVEQRRRSGLDRPTATAVPPKTKTEQSPAVDRKIKPSNESEKQPIKYFAETTKPFEMADFYKYSTKYRKTSVSSLNDNSDSSPRSSTASSGTPPEVPARPTPQGSIGGSPAKVPPPPPPKSDKVINNNCQDSLADSFCSEMLDWYDTKKKTESTAVNSGDNNKPATLV